MENKTITDIAGCLATADNGCRWLSMGDVHTCATCGASFNHPIRFKTFCYAYPTSPKAIEHGHGKTGCYYIEINSKTVYTQPNKRTAIAVYGLTAGERGRWCLTRGAAYDCCGVEHYLTDYHLNNLP